MIVIKQPPVYMNLATHLYQYYEPHDHTLVVCDYNGCTRLCEKGVGMCDSCINKMTDIMARDLDEVVNGK
jgi:hypothetical protein